MIDLNKKFENRKIIYNKLLDYGFKKKDNSYVLSSSVLDNHFTIEIVINDHAFLKVFDNDYGEEYLPVYRDDVSGEFVGLIKAECNKLISDIIDKCTVINMFKEKSSISIISYIKNKYNDELEFLWDKLPDCAIVRNKTSDKWYAVFMKISGSVFGLEDELIEIVNVKVNMAKIKNLIDYKKIFPAYHMSKKSWISIKLNEISLDELKKMIDNSYILTTGNKTGLKMEEMSKLVYDYLLTIPYGKVVTYGQVAEFLGNRGLARIVGTILHNNPDEEKYPCYKVLNSKGELADEFAFGGVGIQKKRLESEGIKVVNNKVDLNVYKWEER